MSSTPPAEHTSEDKVSLNVKQVLLATVAAGTGLMALSIFAPTPDAVKEVLPFATGLVGFAGGLVTAIFGK